MTVVLADLDGVPVDSHASIMLDAATAWRRPAGPHPDRSGGGDRQFARAGVGLRITGRRQQPSGAPRASPSRGARTRARAVTLTTGSPSRTSATVCREPGRGVSAPPVRTVAA
ncbi:MAG: hypothetical protein QOD55_2333 [Solirubrobacteraceae bacterium]|nr:hypothetical protein [Solirubrobacteraceae bacterium]